MAQYFQVSRPLTVSVSQTCLLSQENEAYLAVAYHALRKEEEIYARKDVRDRSENKER